MIKRDYKCEQHGFFEAWEPQCPHGCTEGLMIVHLSAPALLSDSTKKADGTLRGLASDFQMTDIKSTREGEAQSGYLTRNNQPAPPQQPQMQNGVIWGGAGAYTLQNVMGGGAVRSVRGENVGFNPRSAGDLHGPRPASYIQDHENLSLKGD